MRILTCAAWPLLLALARWTQDCLRGPPRMLVLDLLASSQLTVSSRAYMAPEIMVTSNNPIISADETAQ